MANRERFIECVRVGSEAPFVSLQIGGGAGFDAKLAGKEFNSDATLTDTVRAFEAALSETLLIQPLPDPGDLVPELKWRSKTNEVGGRRVTKEALESPFGTLSRSFLEMKKTGVTPTRYALDVDTPDVLGIVRWYAEMFGKAVEAMPDLVGPIADLAHPHGPLVIQWNVQPFELLGLPSTPDVAMLSMLENVEFRAVCDVIRDVNIEMIRGVVKAGADFIFVGGPGSEMISPRLYEQFLVPDSRAISDATHEAGGLVYSHICSPVEPFLSAGYYNQMGLDLFETLSPPPVGNVPDLRYARGVLDENICTRGNIGLDVLLNGSTADVEAATYAVLEATTGCKHMVGASDYLFYDIPLENARTVARTASAYRPADPPMA